MMDYSELQVTSNFSFLRGGSHPEELVTRAAKLGYTKIALTDRNTLAGQVRAHVAAKAAGISFIPACRLDLADGPSLLAYPTDKAAYARLSALLTLGNLRAEKGDCLLYRADVYQYAQGLLFVALPPDHLNQLFDFEEPFKKDLQEYREKLGASLHLAASWSYGGQDHKKLFRLAHLAQELGVPLIATGDVHYHVPERRQLQDVLTCVREKCTISTAGFMLEANAERHLKGKEELERLFAHYPQAMGQAQELAGACTFSLDELRYVYPAEINPSGRSPMEELTHLTWQGAKAAFAEGTPEKTLATIKHELSFIEQMDYANYFLFVHDIVREARSRGILCQGRGSAANSAVCYCLGITSVDPSKFDLLFERFISSARNEPPDIDVDFEHERREEIIQYIYEKYGRDRAAIVATVTQQRQKGAIRDVGKVMGLSVDTVNRLSASLGHFTDEWFSRERIAEQGLNPEDPLLQKTLELTRQMLGFPRQLGQHTGGFVVTNGKLSDLCPIMNARMAERTNIEWNKDDIDALGFLKVDVLALGMLTCIRKAFELCKTYYGKDLTLANIQQDDPKVYQMVTAADTIGVFQIESRAQQSMLPRLRPKCFYDLVIEVAIVRPGPIVGDMVHPYLRRRNGEEKVEYPSKELEEILGRTLGVPLFQEQAMKIAIVAAGFTPAEADALRRSMATFKFKGMVNHFEQKLVDGMMARGYKEDFARRIFRQLEGFGSYGFPESHAASFALLVYVSCYLKCYYPDAFACALLNSMPMGFYQPAQIVIDARRHGVEVRAVDVNHSHWDNAFEEKAGNYYAIRLGFRQVSGLRQDDMDTLVAQRLAGYRSITALSAAGLSAACLERLADADAFRSLGLDRRQALWEVSALGDQPVALFEGQASQSALEGQTELPFMDMAQHVRQDYASTSLSLKAHPLGLIRGKLALLHVLSTRELTEVKEGLVVKAAGLVLVRQRPGTAKGVCFITLEDETGVTNLVIFAGVFEQYRKEILTASVLGAEGKLQRESGVTHVIVTRLFNLSGLLGKTRLALVDGPLLVSDSGEASSTSKDSRTEVFPAGRNFK